LKNMPVGILLFKAASITGPLQKGRKAPCGAFILMLVIF